MTTRKPRRRKTTQPVGNALRGFKEARKTKSDLLREIQTHVVAEGNKNAGVGREPHKIHISELIKDACPRQLYYKITKEPRDPPKASAFHRLELIWAAGNAEHEKWQRWLWQMGDLWGSWHCNRCDGDFIALAPEACEKCGFVGFLEYREVELEDDEYYLVGHADGAVPRLGTLVEVKSFSIGTVRVENPGLLKDHTHKIDGKTVVDIDSLWDAIKRPLKGHLKQGLFYLWLCYRAGLPYEKIIFIYENKANQATKTFEVTRNDRLIKPYLEMLDALLENVEVGEAPERPKLYAPDAKPCNSCPFLGPCWGAPEETDDDTGEEAPEVPRRGSRARSDADGGEAEVRRTRASSREDSGRTRRSDRTGRSRTDHDDDADDSVVRASRRSTRAGRSGRTVGGSGDGQGSGSRFARTGSRRH